MPGAQADHCPEGYVCPFQEPCHFDGAGCEMDGTLIFAQLIVWVVVLIVTVCIIPHYTNPPGDVNDVPGWLGGPNECI